MSDNRKSPKDMNEAALADAKAASFNKRVEDTIKNIQRTKVNIGRSNIYEKIIDQHNRSTRTRNLIKQDLENVHFNKRDIDFYKDLISKAKKSQNSEAEYNIFNLDNANVFNDIIESQKHISKRKSSYFKKIQSIASDRTKKKIHTNITDTLPLDEDKKRKIASVINETVDKFEFEEKLFTKSDFGKNNIEFDIEKFSKKFDNLDLSKEQKLNLSKSIKDIYSREKQYAKSKSEDISKFENEIQGNIAKKLLSYQSMKEKHGVKTDKKDNRLTIGELLNMELDEDEFNYSILGKDINVKEELEQLVAKDEKYKNIIVDPNLRIGKDGKVKNIARKEDIVKKAKEQFEKSPISGFFNIYQLLESKDTKGVITFHKGDKDPILSSVEGNKGPYLRNTYHLINKSFYRETASGKLVKDKRFEDYYVVDGSKGLTQRLVKQLTIEGPARDGRKGEFDIRKKYGQSSLDAKKAFFKKAKDPRWEGNVLKEVKLDNTLEGLIANYINEKEIEDLKDLPEEFSSILEKEISNRMDRIGKLNRAFSKITQAPSSQISSFLKESENARYREYGELLSKDGEELFQELTKKWNDDNTGTPFNNPELYKLIRKYTSDRDGVLSQTRRNLDSYNIGKSKYKDISEILKIETTKEIMMDVMKKEKHPNKIFELIQDSSISGEERKNLERIASWVLLESETNYTGLKRGIDDQNNKMKAIFNFEHLFKLQTEEGGDDQKALHEFRRVVKNMYDENYNLLSKGAYQPPVDEEFDYKKFITIRKAITPIEAINDETKRKAFFKQFVAGKDDPENITTATLVPYYFLDRANRLLDPIGLSFSGKDASSSSELFLNLALKRVLPAAGAIKGLSYLDYRMEAYTGLSLRGATANVAANVDLGFRGFADTVGLSSKLDRMKAYNPILQYITGSDSFDSKEKRREYYERGKSPVRSGRYFSFGSLGEFRGGKISYFQPNWFQRMHSDAKDISIYGSTKEKWKYSWLPTPRHPLAPLRRLLDPHRLERRNYWDRPYAYTGDMFGHSIPGSGILNATVGAVLKPRVSMHREHTIGRAGNKYVDSRAILEEENARIKEQANQGLVQLGEDGGLTPVSLKPFKEPGTQEVNIKIRDRQISVSRTSNQEDIGLTPEEFQDRMNEIIESRDAIFDSGSITKSGKFSTVDRIKAQVREDIGNPFLDLEEISMKQKTVANNLVNKMNKEIVEQANQVTSGRITRDQIFSVKASDATHLLHDTEVMADLRNLRTTSEYLSDTLYQGKKFTGIYGFAYDNIRGGKRKKAVLEDASRMTSFSRTLYDQNLGGLGGRPMAFVRRIMPRGNQNLEQVNYIRNTMPHWMPDRFKYGDPYASIPKGEMRLPGAGYESMYDLHPDRYGKEYGAFDRMKILADVAPWSPEYKLWRDIASEEVKDPELMKEMEEIRKRVIEQSKRHDFYNYKFKGVKVDTEDAVITDVIGKNQFKIQGDNTIYRLARVGEITEYDAYDILKPGMTVKLTTGRDEEEDAPEKAAIVHYKGKNINKELVKKGYATEGGEDTVMDAQAFLSGADITKGKIWETIAHADIPIVHKKFLNINSPLESYKQEMVYGSNHNSWSKPLKGWIKPLSRESLSIGLGRQLLGTGLLYSYLSMEEGIGGLSPAQSKLLKGSLMLTNKGAMVGAGVGYLLGGSELSEKGAIAGGIMQSVGYSFANSNQIAKSTLNTGSIGAILGHHLFRNKTENAGLKGALVGAALGLTTSAMQTNILSKRQNKYIPKETRKRWELEEYFDRLKYMKYMGLYEKSARLAKKREGVDIRKITTQLDKERELNRKRKEELLNSREKVSNSYTEGDPVRRQLLAEIDHKIALLDNPETLMQAGSYTKAAVMFKEAAESTIYGLTEDSDWSKILRALPSNERDYMLEFAKEQDPKKRKEIYNLVSPYQRKVLDIAWGNKVKRQRSNASYFAKHKVPGAFWSGWNSTTNVDDVKLKVIKNEGMLLSDYGFHESQLQDPNYINAPNLGNFKRNTAGPFNFLHMIRAMNGRGVSVNNVRIEPTRKPGIKARMNIKRARRMEVKRGIAKELKLPIYI